MFSPSLAAAPSVSSIVQHRLRRTAQAAALLLIAGTFFGAVAQASAAAGVPLWAAVGTPLRELLSAGRFALIWWPRLGAEFVIAGLLSSGPLEAVWSDLALSIVPAIVLTSSLATHGAALPIGVVPGVALDWFHLLGAAVWVGGLASLLIVIPELIRHKNELLQPMLRQIMRRFSRLAVVAVAMLGLSGVVQAVLEVGSWEALFETAYGLTVVAKAMLTAFMVALGATNVLNTRLSSRSVGTAGVRPGYLTRRLVSHVRAELIIGVLLLGLAAMLTGLIPAWLARTGTS